MSLKDFYSLPALVMFVLGVLSAAYVKSSVSKLRSATGA